MRLHAYDATCDCKDCGAFANFMKMADDAKKTQVSDFSAAPKLFENVIHVDFIRKCRVK